MKTVVLGGIGGRLELLDVKEPRPKPNELLIRIYATTVTIGDVIVRKLPFPIRIGLGLMLGRGRVLGHELAGEVQSVGGEVTRFRSGDAVFASTGYAGGANAEFICLPETGTVALKPANLTYDEAAAVPVGGLTALHFLKKAAIQPGQTILIYGASGSVGSYAVQLARHFGAMVTAVCSTGNLEWVKDLGAERVVDYTKADFSASGGTYDIVFDAVGKVPDSKGKRALRENGMYLSVRKPARESAEGLAFLRELIEAGRLKPVIDRIYPLEQVADAHQYVETGRKKGNVVLTVGRPHGL